MFTFVTANITKISKICAMHEFVRPLIFVRCSCFLLVFAGNEKKSRKLAAYVVVAIRRVNKVG